jgi:integrase
MASIVKRPDGQWRARYRDAAGKEHARHFARKIDGQQWLDTVTSSVVTGTYVDPRAGKVTFDAFYREWAARQVWVASTTRAMDLTRRSVTFGAVALTDLRASHVEAWVKRMSAAGLAATTIASRMNGVRAALTAAVRDRVIPSDPSSGVRLPRRRRAEHAMTIPTPQEVGRILAASDPYMRPLVLLCAFAGLRLGEACGVQLDDVDFLRRQLRVTRQVQRVKGGGVESCPPKYGSERVVHLPDEVVTMLSQHVERCGTARAGWLVSTVAGAALPPTTVHAWWVRTCAAAGVDGLRLHGLRHFYASGLIAAGCDVVTVQRALGHANATTTLNTYSHLWPSAEDRTRKAAAELFSAALADSVRTEVAL